MVTGAHALVIGARNHGLTTFRFYFILLAGQDLSDWSIYPYQLNGSCWRPPHSASGMVGVDGCVHHRESYAPSPSTNASTFLEAPGTSLVVIIEEFWPQPERWAGVPMVEGDAPSDSLGPTLPCNHSDHGYRKGLVAVCLHVACVTQVQASGPP